MSSPQKPAQSEYPLAQDSVSNTQLQRSFSASSSGGALRSDEMLPSRRPQSSNSIIDLPPSAYSQHNMPPPSIIPNRSTSGAPSASPISDRTRSKSPMKSVKSYQTVNSLELRGRNQYQPSDTDPFSMNRISHNDNSPQQPIQLKSQPYSLKPVVGKEEFQTPIICSQFRQVSDRLPNKGPGGCQVATTDNDSPTSISTDVVPPPLWKQLPRSAPPSSPTPNRKYFRSPTKFTRAKLAADGFYQQGTTQQSSSVLGRSFAGVSDGVSTSKQFATFNPLQSVQPNGSLRRSLWRE